MDAEKEKLHLLESLATDSKYSSEGQQFNDRILRYGKAKKIANCTRDYINESLTQSNKHRKLSAAIRDCGSYLVFHHYFTQGEIRLTKASLCRKHLLCPLCAIRRGSKTLGVYLDKYEQIIADNPSLNAYLVTLTVKDGADLRERVNHLRNSFAKYKKNRKRATCTYQIADVHSLVYSIEVKRGKRSGEWHPHMHCIWLSETPPDAFKLSQEWHSITKDSFIVDARPISQDDHVSGFLEVFKYAVKFSTQSPEDTWHCFDVLSGSRLLGSLGGFYGLPEPDELDDSLDNLPYVELFFKYTGHHYQYLESKDKFNQNLDSNYLEKL